MHLNEHQVEALARSQDGGNQIRTLLKSGEKGASTCTTLDLLIVTAVYEAFDADDLTDKIDYCHKQLAKAVAAVSKFNPKPESKGLESDENEVAQRMEFINSIL